MYNDLFHWKLTNLVISDSANIQTFCCNYTLSEKYLKLATYFRYICIVMCQFFNNISDILTSVWNLFLGHPVGVAITVLCIVVLLRFCSAVDKGLKRQ